MATDPLSLELLRGQVFSVVLGSIFAFVGIVALAISSVRHRERFHILAWFGAFSALYGLRLLVETQIFFLLLPHAFLAGRPYLIAVLTHIILIPALFVWFELTTGNVRRFTMVIIIAAAIVALLGIGNMLVAGETQRLMPINNILAIIFTMTIAVVNIVPLYAKRYLKIYCPVLIAGSLVLAAAVIQANLATFLPYRRREELEPIAFGIFVLSIGYVAVERVLINERRLFSIEQELEIAREIQASILPSTTPTLPGLRIAAAYYPMTSVAGDFYDFVQIDDRRAGLLIADVSGHGVPAALIASMIKVAMHAVQSCAADPGELLGGLNRILSQQLNGQFVTAGYLYVDVESKVARYAGAGHPPLIHWNAAAKELKRIESNGLLFGVLKESQYPTVEIPLRAGDRFLMYTDGLVEPENTSGEAFGDRRMAEVLLANPNGAATEIAKSVFEEMTRWSPASATQSDDVSLIVLEAAQGAGAVS